MNQRLGSGEEKQLVTSMLAGEESAFDAIYASYHTPVFRFILQMTGSTTTSEEILQEVFMSLVTQGHSFDPDKGRLLSYLYGIARNKVHRSFSSPRRREQPLEAAGATLLEQAKDQRDPVTDLSRQQEIETLRKAILNLPERYREVIVLCDLHEMSYQDASEVVQCSIGTVRSRLHRGRSLLIEKMRATIRPAIQCGTARPAGGYL